MKIRTSFVTNSSSSSFIIVGVHGYNRAIDKLRPFIEEEEDGWGDLERSIAIEGLYIERTGECSYAVTLDDTDFENKTVKQMKQEFVDICKSKGVDIGIEEITFEYGGYYNG